MIIFDLKCSKGHTFEGWFEDTRAFDAQRRNHLIVCPICEDTEISKIFSTLSIKSSSASRDAVPDPKKMVRMGEKIAQFVEKNFDNVGSKFASEALKMHYGVIEPRNIRGVSTEQEEKVLKNEGIEFFKIPALPNEKTDA